MVPLTTAKKRGVVWYCTQKSLDENVVLEI